jgi:uncharacterized protein (TIGR02145 family)
MYLKTLISFLIISSTVLSQYSNNKPKTNVSKKQTIGAPKTQISANYGTLQDIDGNTYRTIKIGTQTWMADNLKVKRFNDGSLIDNLTDNIEYVFLNNASGSKSFPCWNYYNNDNSNNLNYGKLYNIAVVNVKINNNKNICPAGWHVPSKNDLEVLFNSLGGIEQVDNYFVNDQAGKKLKSKDLWKISDSPGLNSSFFNAVPGGSGIAEVFTAKGEIGTYWSSDNSISGESWCLNLFNDEEFALIQSMPNLHVGYSIRCLQD